MIKRFRYLLASGLIALTGVVALPLAVHADTPTGTACRAITGDSNCNDSSGGLSVNNLVHTIVNILSIIVGVASVIMIIIGGFRYVISSGDANAASSARNTIIYALIGLIVVAFAQFLVQFVFQKVKTSGGGSGLVRTERFAATPLPYRILN